MEETKYDVSVEPQEYETFLAELGDVLTDARRLAVKSFIATEKGLSWEKQHVVGIYLRCLHLYDAVCDLVGGGYAEAVMIVGRSLLVDSLTLRYMALRPSLLEQHIGKWRRGSARQELGLARMAKEAGLQDADLHIRDANQELHELNEFLRGIPSTGGTLPQEKAMATAIGDLEAYWEIKFCSNIVHPTAMAIGRLYHERDGFLVTEPFITPLNLQFAGSLFSDALLDATESAAKLLDIPTNLNLPEARNQVEGELKRLQRKALSLMGLNPDNPMDA